MKLVEIWNADLDKAYDLHMSMPKEESGFENTCYGLSKDEFVEYVKVAKRHSEGLDLPEGHVPDTIYILVDDNDNYVGRFNFRHYLNEFLANGPGHIGYIIRKEYRGHNYATKGLYLVFEKCREKGIKEVYMSCNIDNEASLKTQLKAGGKIHHQDSELYYTRTII